MGSLIGNLTYPCGDHFFLPESEPRSKRHMRVYLNPTSWSNTPWSNSLWRDFLSRGGLGMLQGSRGYAVVLVSWNLDSTVCYAVIWRVTHERRCGMMSGRVFLDSQRISEAPVPKSSWLLPFAFFLVGSLSYRNKAIRSWLFEKRPHDSIWSIYITFFKGILAAHSLQGLLLLNSENFTHIPIGHIPTLGSTSRFVKIP